jgi:hypothetical protein
LFSRGSPHVSASPSSPRVKAPTPVIYSGGFRMQRVAVHKTGTKKRRAQDDGGAVGWYGGQEAATKVKEPVASASAAGSPEQDQHKQAMPKSN